MEDLKVLEKMMEEMAGMPIEKLGERQPGEACIYAGERNVLLTEEELDTLQWAKDFLNKFEKKYGKKR